METVVVTEDGRITIPASLRKKYGIRHGVKVRWLDTKAGLVMILETRRTVKLKGLWKGLNVNESETGRAKKSLFKDAHN